MSVKGSWSRVKNPKKFGDNYERIFRLKKRQKHQRNGRQNQYGK